MNSIQIKRDEKGRFTAGNGRYTKIAIVIFALLGVVMLLLRAADWGASHQVVIQKPWTLDFATRPVVVISEREPEVIISPMAEAVTENIDYGGLNGVEKVICDKWGLLECKIALAVQLAENSGQDADVLNYNSNRTYDVGIMQINSIHWDSDYCGSLHDLTTVEANVDCAYNIWDRADGEMGDGSGSWTPWVQYNNGVFMNNL